jgi:hypothetical protein
MQKRTLLMAGVVVLFAMALLPLRTEALSVTPAIRELTLTPGESKTAAVELNNDSADSITLTAEVVNFTAKGETGEPQYLNTPATGVATWMKVDPEKIVLTPGQKAEVAVTFTTPANASTGGHYAGVLFNFGQTGDNAQPGQVSILSKIGVPFLVTVKGSYVQKGEIATFSTDKESYTASPVAFTLRYKNTGEVHLKPAGTITISNMFGKVVKTIKVNQDGGAVLPGSVRKFAVDNWDEVGNSIGQYKATITLTSGTVETQATVSFWVYSTMGIVYAVVILLVIIILIFVLVGLGKKKTKVEKPS